MIDMDCSDAVESTVVPADMEYKLRIIACDGIRYNSSNNPYILPRFEIVDKPSSKDFTQYIGLPTEDLDAKRLNRTKFALKIFKEACGLDPASPFDPEDLVGTEVWAILGIETSDEYGEQNFIKKFITPE